MTLRQAIVLIVSGMIGTLGFALLFRVNRKRVIFCVIGGGLTCVVYVISCSFFEHEFMQNVFPALVATIYSEIMARVTKAPALPYLACSIIPLVPGGKLYYTMYYFVVSNDEMLRLTFIQTIRIAEGLAVGIMIVSVIVHEINHNKFKQILDQQPKVEIKE